MGQTSDRLHSLFPPALDRYVAHVKQLGYPSQDATLLAIGFREGWDKRGDAVAFFSDCKELHQCPEGTIIELAPYRAEVSGLIVPYEAQVAQLLDRADDGDLWYFVGSDIPYAPHQLHMPAKLIRWGTGEP